MEYLTQRRLEYALHLLLTSDLPVAQVAEACGFGDASYFGKRFRKQMGLTPSQYRHRIPPPGSLSPPTETCNRRRLSLQETACGRLRRRFLLIIPLFSASPRP